MSTLQNKTVVVVGGSSGIGFGVALAALQSLASVVIIASSNAERVAKSVERLKAHNLSGEVRGDVVDATDGEALKSFAARLGAIDHIVWTSGDMPKQLTGGEVRKPDILGDAFNVRFLGPLMLSQHAQFKAGGSLTLTSGIRDIRPGKGLPVLSGTAAALEGLVRGLAVDLAPVRVNLVAPGGIMTEIWDNPDIPVNVKEKMLQAFSSRLLERPIGEPHDIAEAYLFFMKCQFVTGQRINIDGGITLV